MNDRASLILPGALLTLALLAGCRTTPPPAVEGSLAWVKIEGHTGAEIKQATVAVFKESGYRMKTNSMVDATFEKPGGALKNLAYGGWDSGVTLRVIVHIRIQNDGSHLLHCEAFIVRDAGDRSVEDARPIHYRRRDYQELLDRINARLPASR